MSSTTLIQILDSIRGRVKLLTILYGLGIVVAAAMGLLAVVVGIDWLLNLQPIPRLLVGLLSIGSLGYLSWRYVVRPALARLTLLDVAGRLEQAFPQFDDRLRSTVDFLDKSNGRTNPGSDVMQQRVIEQTTGLAGQVDLRRAVVKKPALISLTSAAGAIAAVLLFATLILSPATLSIISSRLLNPFNGQAWPKRVQIALLGQAPTRVPVGQKIDVRMKLERGDKASLKPIVYYQLDSGPVQQEFMTRAADGTYKTALDARLEPGVDGGKLKIWMEAGDDKVELPQVAVVPRLAIRGIVALVTPPRYVPARAPTTIDLAAAPAVMAEGSSVSVEVRFNKPLAADLLAANPLAGSQRITLEPVGDNAVAPAHQWTHPAPDIAVVTFAARAPLRFRIKATDIDGFTNTALEEYELIVRPDAVPVVQLENPRRSEDRTPDAVVPLKALIEDDNGITWAKLIVDRVVVGDAKPQRWEIPLVENAAAAPGVNWGVIDGSPDRVRTRAALAWELSKLPDAQLKPGDVLEYFVLTKDNFEFDGKSHAPVSSSKLRLTIISQEDLGNRVADELRAVKTQLGVVRNTQNSTRQQTEQLAEETKDKPQLDAADKAAGERLTQTQSSAASATKQLSKRIEDVQAKLEENRSNSEELKTISKDVKEELDRTSDGAMKDATQNLTEANQPKPANDKAAEQRNEEFQNAAENQQKSLAGLDRAMARMENIGTLESAIAKLSDILAKQEKLTKDLAQVGKNNLGKKPEAMNPQDKKELDRIADEQAKLADETQKAIDKMEKQADQMKASDPASSEAMKDAAQKGNSQKVPPNQKKAADQAKQNQQAPAQAAQQQVELGLKMMLGSLQEAENRKLRELQAKLLEMQKQIANLIRRQANHNYDNLALQGDETVKATKPETITQLTDLSQRAADQKKVELPQLSSGQELTEQNTRDLAKTAEAVPQTADAAAQMTKAAGKMERAIVSLRDQKLPAAYDPSQVDALAALLDAKNVIDEQKKQADEKLENQQKEALRQRFVKIRDDQKKLNEETSRIETARDGEGKLKRADDVRLGQLPGDQGGLSGRVGEMDQDLLAVGSVVYVWANKDIKKSMDDVKDLLGQKKTQVATRAEQERIVAQLDAMIKNLADKPPEKKFDQPKGGGGGGQAGQPRGPRMPPEAELRLLKALQEAVNKSTAKIDADPKKDNETLLRLGNRQGDLRNVLDNLLDAATKGQLKLDPEPKNENVLPEEKEEVIDELDDDLLNGDADPEADKTTTDVKTVGTRMSRSRQRLALNNDPGKTTQIVQERIILALDKLIEEAQRQQQNQQQQQQQGQNPGQQRPGAQQGEQANNQGENKGQQQPSKSTEGANKETASNGHASGEPTKDIKESAAEWGGLPPRLRDPVVESKNETMVEQYRKLIEDYYQALSKQGGK